MMMMVMMMVIMIIMAMMMIMMMIMMVQCSSDKKKIKRPAPHKVSVAQGVGYLTRKQRARKYPRS